MAEYYSLLQKGEDLPRRGRVDSVIQSYATNNSAVKQFAYATGVNNMMEGRNSTTTGVHTAGVFSNDPYKSPEVGTAFSMTADE